MSSEVELKRDRTPEVLSTPEVAEEPRAEDKTAFSATGPLPDVAPVATKPPTASELAFEQGPGVKKLGEMLAGGTAPDPDKVVEVIDAHRAESPAMFAYLESKLGAPYVEQVREAMNLRLSIKRRELVAGDPTNEDGGYFIASESEKGARWRTSGGGFKGTANKDGLDTTLRIDSDDQLHAKTDKKGNGTLAWERDGKSVGELYRNNTELGARRQWDLGEHGDLTTGVRNRTHGNSSTNEVFAAHTTEDKKWSTDAAVGVNEGTLAATTGVTYKPSATDSYSGRLTHNHDGTSFAASGTHGLDGGAKLTGSGDLLYGPTGTITGSLGGAYENEHRRIDGRVTRGNDQTSYHLGATEKLTPELSLTGSLDHVDRDIGTGQSTLRLGERYRSPNLIHQFDLEAGHGERNYLAANGSLDARLAPNLYGGAFGGFRVEDGHQTTGQLGASLTFTPHEKAALTLAGVLDESGSLETRLQLDVFKSKINGVGTLADHKKDALVSLFVSYSTAGKPGRLDERYGGSTLSTPVDDRVMAGIKIKF